ncbi:MULTISPECIES: hypothetical protein [unclassified Microcoleus]|uniref:hypothetical protein n=1 Tax=unclassified Microcoleus TaxID=2642155 RepID=UPI002FD0558E
MIINQLLSIGSFIAIQSFKARDVIQLLGISGAAIALEFRDILENLRAGILILLLAPAQGYKPPTLVVSHPKFLTLVQSPRFIGVVNLKSRI